MYIPIQEMLCKAELTHPILNMISEIGIRVGKNKFWGSAFTEYGPLLHNLHKSATYLSLSSVNRMLRLKISKQRITDIINGDKGITENEFLATGYRDKSENLYKYRRNVSFGLLVEIVNSCTGYKTTANEDSPNSTLKQFLQCNDDNIEQIKSLICQYQSLLTDQSMNKLVIGVLFLGSLSTICPFSNNMLIMLLVLTKATLSEDKNSIMHFSSFEELVEQSYDEFITLMQNIQNNKNQSVSKWIEYFLSKLRDMYDKFYNLLQKNNTKRDVKSLTALQELQKIAPNDPFSVSTLISKNRTISKGTWLNVIQQLIEKNKIGRIDNGKYKSLFYRKAAISLPTTSTDTRPVSHKGIKTQRVRTAIENMRKGETFTFEDMRKHCCGEGIDGASEVTVRKALAWCKQAGLIVCNQQGRSSRWRKVLPSE